MIEQTIQTKGNATGQLGKAGESGKGDAKGDPKGGLFAKLITSFQKHIKQTETHLQAGGQTNSSKGKVASHAGQAVLLKINPESVEKAGKIKLPSTVDQAGKTAESVKAQAEKGGQVKGGIALSAKGLLQNSNAQGLVKKDGEKQDVSNMEKLAVDDTEKLQKHAAIGLGAFQQELRESTTKTVGNVEAKEKVFTGSEGKNNKSTEHGSKAPHLVMGIKDSIEQKGMSVGQEKAGQTRIAGEALVPGTKPVEVAPAKQTPQGHFSLKGMDGVDDNVDASKIIKSDEVVSVKNQVKKGESDPSKPVPLASTASVNDDVKSISSDGINIRQTFDEAKLSRGKLAGDSEPKQGLDATGKSSKTKAPFQAVTANRSNAANAQAQASMSVASSVQGAASTAVLAGSDTNTSGDDRGMGRSAAELLMTDSSIRDARSTTRSDFAMQMAYRSAASFKPADAMLEISKAAKDGAMKLDMMLEPATLGKIQVTLQVDAQKQIQVHMVVDQQTSRQVLEQQMPQLRQALADQGLSLSGFTMDMNSQQQNSDGSPRGGADTGRANGQTELGSSVPLDVPLRMGVNIANDGALSILA